jgi:hypothetical protein
MKPKIFPALFLVLALALSLVGSASASTTTGTWTLYPERATSYIGCSQRPIQPVGPKGQNNGKASSPSNSRSWRRDRLFLSRSDRIVIRPTITRS